MTTKRNENYYNWLIKAKDKFNDKFSYKKTLNKYETLKKPKVPIY